MKPEMKQILVVGTVLAIATVILAVSLSFNPVVNKPAGFDDEDLGQFNSIEEIRAYLEERSSGDSYYGGIAKSFSTDSVGAPSVAMEEGARADGDSAQSGGGANSYSQTNVQVEGVDEPDIVKNDGKYIYVVSGNKISIIDAYPAENMEILDKIDFGEDYVSNIFVNGDKLVVFVNHYEYVDTGIRCGDIYAFGVRCGGYSKEEAKVYVYDISDRSDAELDEEYAFSGNYVDARMIGDNVYLISQKYIYRNDFVMPYVKVDGVEKMVAPSDVYYFPQNDESYVFNTIAAIDLASGETNSETYLMGSSGATYVSENNIFLTYQTRLSQEYIVGRYLDEVLLPALPGGVANDIENVWNDDDMTQSEKQREIGEKLEDFLMEMESDEQFEFQNELEDKAFEFFKEIEKEQQQTKIHRINVDGLDISHEASGAVPGNVLNQFSMDEFDGNFRIATTTGGWQADENENHLYVLNSDLEIIGSVEGLAEGERIYSARFMGDKAYMVTFRQTDPLFAIDLSDPTNPQVIGELKVTGYSGYLHPYDENHLIGIGMEASEEGRVQGLKISMFDVSDMENPREVGKYNFDEQWSSSDAVYDHKAVLFDREKNLLVIPVSYSKNWEEAGIYRYDYWQGAYVFDIDTSGIDLKGKITHQEKSGRDYYGYGGYVRRSLFMDDVLYTISDSKVKANSLSDLDEIESVDLPTSNYGGPILYAEGDAVKSSAGVAEPMMVE